MNATDKAAPTLANIPIGDLAKHCQDPAMLDTIISLAYQRGYKLGQEQAHRYYNIMFKGGEPMIIDWERDALGELADEGYTLKEWADNTIELQFKDQSVSAWHRLDADLVTIRNTALRHKANLVAATEVVQ